MIGITLKHFAKLQSQGENVKAWKLTILLLNRAPKLIHKTKEIDKLTFAEFVDCERFLLDENYIEFCRIFVIKNWLKPVYVHNLKAILEKYAAEKQTLFDNFNYIFNPPQYGEPGKETIGSDLRKEFAEEFGAWVVLMDVVCKGEITKYKEVEKWELGEFLFWANYLSGQRLVENIK